MMITVTELIKSLVLVYDDVINCHVTELNYYTIVLISGITLAGLVESWFQKNDHMLNLSTLLKTCN